MEITRVKIGLCDDARIKAYASITLDDCFVIHGLRLTHSEKEGLFSFHAGNKAEILLTHLTTRRGK